MTPAGLERVFYTDNGSTGIEVALKMSFHYWRNCGRERKQRFVTLTNSYHGETVAAMSVGDVALFTDTYKPLLLDTFKVPSPDCYLRPEASAGKTLAADVRAHGADPGRASPGHRAVIVEPLIQGAGGMRMYHPIYLKLLREACDRYEVHLIHDEIAVGFGAPARCSPASRPASRRTSSAKALPAAICRWPRCHHRPPVSGVLRRLLDPARLSSFAHLHRQSAGLCRRTGDAGHLRRGQRHRGEQGAGRMASATAHLGHPHVAEVRQTGMALAIEMVQENPAVRPTPGRNVAG